MPDRRSPQCCPPLPILRPAAQPPPHRAPNPVPRGSPSASLPYYTRPWQNECRREAPPPIHLRGIDQTAASGGERRRSSPPRSAQYVAEARWLAQPRRGQKVEQQEDGEVPARPPLLPCSIASPHGQPSA